MSAQSVIIPSLLARDLSETRRFYEGLGFCRSGESDGWLEMSLGGAIIQFYGEPPTGTDKSPRLSGVIYVRVADIDAHASELAGKVLFEWGPETMEYGMREFAVRDPNDYLIAFTASARTQP